MESFDGKLNPYEVIMECRKTKSLNERKRLLLKNDCQDLRQVLFYALNPFFVYGNVNLEKFPEPTLHDEFFSYCFNAFYHFCSDLSKNVCKDVPKQLERATASLNEQQQAVAKMILQKDLGFKLSPVTVNEVLGKIVPSYTFPEFNYYDKLEVICPCVVGAYKCGSFFIACVNGNKVVKINEESEVVTTHSKYDKELVELCKGKKRYLLCFVNKSTKSKFYILDILSHENVVNGTVPRGKSVFDVYDNIVALFGDKKLKLLKPFKYKTIHSETRLENWKATKLKKNKKLVGFLIRTEDSKKINVEVLV